SFAEVVRPGSFSSVGNCVEATLGGIKGIKVDEKGVKERVEYLERCLVIRLAGKEVTSSDWDHFLSWSKKTWGVQVEKIHALSDDLWLLKLPTEDDVARVIRLGRWRFREWTLEADRWFPFAGRSRVTAGRGVVWLKVAGIPVHLRSINLFKCLGDCCGQFLDYKDLGCSWNEVRVKIRGRGAISRQIPVSYGGSVFLTQISVDDERIFGEGWRGAGSEVYVRAPTQGLELSGSGRAAGNPTGVAILEENDNGLGDSAKNSEGGKQAERKRKGVVRVEVAAGTSDGDSSTLIVRKEKEGGALGTLERVDKLNRKKIVSEEAVVGGEETGLPLEAKNLGPRIFLEEVVGGKKGELSPRVPGELRPNNFGPGLEGQIATLADVQTETELGRVRFQCLEDPKAQWVFSQDKTGEDVLALESDPPSDSPFKESDCETLVNETEDEGAFGSEATSPQDVIADTEEEIEELVGGTALKVRGLGGEEEEEEEVMRLSLLLTKELDLKLKGGRIAAELAVKETAAGVLLKRKEAVSSSKKERELRRLHIDGTFSDTEGLKTRRVRGMDSASISHDY
ncbi:hypothetical protein LINGRAHAP2_LOCUS19339, partial [Linum grandiflorum]